MPESFVTFRYMTRFQCIADRCEDTCCANWRVMVDAASLVRLERHMATPDARRELAEKVIRRPDAPSAELKLDESGACTFLDAKSLCSVQTRYGEEALPTPCAVYPRHVNRVGDRLELAGALSCPEIARLALGAADAMDLIDFAPEVLSRDHRAKVLTPSPSDGYSLFFDDVRSTLLRILAADAYPLSTRLAMVAHIADLIGPYFHKGSTAFVGAAAGGYHQKLAAELSSIGQPALWREVHSQFSEHAASGIPVGQFIASMFASRLQLPHTARFRALVESAFATYRDGGTGVELPDATVLWSRYRDRVQKLEARFPVEIERSFCHYAIQFWMREWYLESDNLLLHLRTLLIRLGALKFLLVGHPRVNALLEGSGAPSESERERMNAIVVEVFQTFVRGVEHEVEFLKIVNQAQDAGRDPFTRALLLLKFL